MALIEHLPAGAALWQELGWDGAWSPETHLLAHVGDMLAVANWQRSGGKKADQPKPLPRPSDMQKKAENDRRTLAKAARFKQKQKLNSKE